MSYLKDFENNFTIRTRNILIDNSLKKKINCDWIELEPRGGSEVDLPYYINPTTIEMDGSEVGNIIDPIRIMFGDVNGNKKIDAAYFRSRQLIDDTLNTRTSVLESCISKIDDLTTRIFGSNVNIENTDAVMTLQQSRNLSSLKMSSNNVVNNRLLIMTPNSFTMASRAESGLNTVDYSKANLFLTNSYLEFRTNSIDTARFTVHDIKMTNKMKALSTGSEEVRTLTYNLSTKVFNHQTIPSGLVLPSYLASNSIKIIRPSDDASTTGENRSNFRGIESI
jgi:hypothetical protein